MREQNIALVERRAQHINAIGQKNQIGQRGRFRGQIERLQSAPARVVVQNHRRKPRQRHKISQ